MKKKSTSLALNKRLISNLTNRAHNLMGGTGSMGPHPNPPAPPTTLQESDCISCLPDNPDTTDTWGQTLIEEICDPDPWDTLLW